MDFTVKLEVLKTMFKSKLTHIVGVFLIAALLLGALPLGSAATVQGAPVAQVRSQQVGGTIPGGQFAKIWLGLTPTTRGATVTILSEWDRNDPGSQGLGFYILDEDGLNQVLSGSARLQDVNLAAGSQFGVDAPANQLGAQFQATGSSYTIVVYNDSNSDANFTLTATNAVITDDSDQVRDLSAPTPAATPHTAARMTRSQSPPRRVQRRPLRPMAAAMATRSMMPYMCTVMGPRSRLPLEGEGMLARRSATARHILPAGPVGVLGQGARAGGPGRGLVEERAGERVGEVVSPLLEDVEEDEGRPGQGDVLEEVGHLHHRRLLVHPPEAVHEEGRGDEEAGDEGGGEIAQDAQPDAESAQDDHSPGHEHGRLRKRYLGCPGVGNHHLEAEEVVETAEEEEDDEEDAADQEELVHGASFSCSRTYESIVAIL